MSALHDSLRITELSERLAAVEARLDDEHGVNAQLADLSAVVRSLIAEEKDKPKLPEPSVRWWELEAGERQAAIGRLRAWIRDIYGPGFGRVAGQLPACWDQHPLCLYVLDVLSQAWMTLWLRETRSLSVLGGQMDLLSRQIKPLADLMQAEAKGCKHPAAAGVRGNRS